MKTLGQGQFRADSPEVVALAQDPEFRRATEAMRMALAACREALKGLPADQDLSQVHVLVGSAYGELETTKDFLQELITAKLARPTLFQNSLHNAILGFLSIQLKLTGCGMTLSNGAQTAQNLEETAELLLNSGEANLVLLCQVDTYMNKLRHLVNYNLTQPLVDEGARAALLTRDH